MKRIEELLAYLDRLIALTNVGTICQREIDEVVGVIRKELGLSSGITVDGMPIEEFTRKLSELDSRI